MKTIKMSVGAVCVFCMVLGSGCVAEPGPKASAEKVRVGTYDSRAVVIAFAGTETFSNQQKILHAEYDKARAAGDKKRMAELEAQGMEQQKLLHKQGFSTAPVDDVLTNIKDRLPEIAKTAGVEVIISKWDSAALARYKSAELVDVTMLLVDALKPNERARRSAVEIQTQKPIPLQQADKMSVND